MRRLTGGILFAVALIAGCGGSSHQSTTSAPAAQVPPAQVVQGWPSKWCQLVPGMTQSQVQTIMGQPTKQGSSSGGATQLTYQGLDYRFVATFDSKGNVSQLQVDARKLSPAEKGQIHCPLSRASATTAQSSAATPQSPSQSGASGGPGCGTIPFPPIGAGARLAVNGTGMSCSMIRQIAARFVSSQVPNQSLLPPGWSIKDCQGGVLGGGGSFPSCRHGNQSFSLRVARGG